VRVVGFNTLVYLVFGVIGFTGAVFALAAGSAPAALALPWLVVIPVLLGAAAWFTAPGRVERWASPQGGWLRQALAIGVGAAWWVRRSLTSAGGRPMLVGAAAYWLGSAAALLAALHAFGSDVGFAAFVLAFATGYAAQFVPVPFIATGGTDAATTFALTAVGVPLEVALLGVASNRIFSFWLPVWPGIALVALLPSTGRALEQASATAGEAADLRVAT
jgi:undecaprenyl-diphosphatase